MRPDSPIVVVKVGGSLLDWPELPSRLGAFLATRADMRPVLIVGGCKLADVLRDLDGVHSLGDLRSHALALRILDVTAHILGDLLPDTRVVSTLDDLPDAWRAGTIPILAPRLVLDADDRLDTYSSLPHAWSTTTDSIAARIARLLTASELILLKSAAPPPDSRLSTAAESGLIDPGFASLARHLPVVSYVNLRVPGLERTVLS